MSAYIIMEGPNTIQVCVPKEWTKEQILEFVKQHTTEDWSIVNESTQCAAIDENVHIILGN